MIRPSQPGIRLCIHCQWLFVSPDPEYIRRCKRCKHNTREEYSSEPATLHMEGLSEALRHDLRETKL